MSLKGNKILCDRAFSLLLLTVQTEDFETVTFTKPVIALILGFIVATYKITFKLKET